MDDEDKKIPEPKKPEGTISPMDEAKNVLAETKKATEELKVQNDRKEKLNADELLSPTAGKHVETPEISEAEKKHKGAEDFFKGTQLGADIKKANE